ncbi:unnamed protein product [Paramecium octaurelia]|uniref:non-specific serine/threonine protein kinase n=1 Tax=Paramecium octaurelia TaxID=43137 RepID=A0A8S1WR22_PAROT|nr:unnamed protein product [Paramecium octaurelia]
MPCITMESNILTFIQKKIQQNYLNIIITLNWTTHVSYHMYQINQHYGIIHPSLDLKNLYINPNTQDIVLVSYYQAYYQQNNEERRMCVNIGYSPPEYFKINYKLTTKSNVYQAGISLFHLLLGHNPFGKTQQEMAINHTNNKLDLTRLNVFDQVLCDFIRQLLEQDPLKRPSPQELLKHKLFSITHKENLSKQTMTKEYHKDIQEFQNFSQTSNIQTVKKSLNFKTRL